LKRQKPAPKKEKGGLLKDATEEGAVVHHPETTPLVPVTLTVRDTYYVLWRKWPGMTLGFEVKEKEARVTVTIQPPSEDELNTLIPDCPRVQIKPTVLEFDIEFPQAVRWDDAARITKRFPHSAFEGLIIPLPSSQQGSKKI